MKSTGNICMIDHWQKLKIRTTDIIAILRDHSATVRQGHYSELTASPRSTLRKALCLMAAIRDRKKGGKMTSELEVDMESRRVSSV
jgi:hypothetical protein